MQRAEHLGDLAPQLERLCRYIDVAGDDPARRAQAYLKVVPELALLLGQYPSVEGNLAKPKTGPDLAVKRHYDALHFRLQTIEDECPEAIEAARQQKA